MTYALLHNDIVIEITEIEFPVAVGLSWIECDDTVSVGWSYDGSTFHAPVAPTVVVTVPYEITNFQARAALLSMPGLNSDANLFVTVNDALLAGSTRDAAGAFAWQAWEQANTFTRNGTLIAQLAASFGLDKSHLDALFIAASTISA